MKYLFYILLVFFAFSTTIKLLSIKSKNRRRHALDDFEKAQTSLCAGDLFKSSECFLKALKGFHREKMIDFEIECYLHLGTIYRYVAAFDDSQIMFEAALRLSEKRKNNEKKSEAYGNLGMLMCAEERLEEALDYYSQALKTNPDNTCILNRKALLFMQQKKYAKAFKEVSLIKRKDALSFELLGRINDARRQSIEAEKQITKAIDLYKKEKNFSAAFEAECFLASAFLKNKSYIRAENILKKTITAASKKTSNFHVAEAFNLLGLVYLQRKKFEKSREMFLSSIKEEEKNKRFCCLAQDYFNLGLVEKKLKNQNEANKHFSRALELAEEYSNENLASLIKNTYFKDKKN